MTTQRTVWVFADCDIQIFLEDGAGNISSANPVDANNNPVPYFQFCFMESGTVIASTEIKRRGVTGRGIRKITTPSGAYDEISFNTENLFLRKAIEVDFTRIFNPNQYIRLVMPFNKLEYTNIAPYENDTFTLSYCKAKSFTINGKGADVVMENCSFEAELIL